MLGDGDQSSWRPKDAGLEAKWSQAANLVRRTEPWHQPRRRRTPCLFHTRLARRRGGLGPPPSSQPSARLTLRRGRTMPSRPALYAVSIVRASRRHRACPSQSLVSVLGPRVYVHVPRHARSSLAPPNVRSVRSRSCCVDVNKHRERSGDRLSADRTRHLLARARLCLFTEQTAERAATQSPETRRQGGTRESAALRSALRSFFVTDQSESEAGVSINARAWTRQCSEGSLSTQGTGTPPNPSP